MSLDVRPLQPADAPAAFEVSSTTFRALDAAAGHPVPELTDELRTRGTMRVAHLQRTDPDGAWGAFDGDRLVGLSLASRRGPLWFLSLLTVLPELQGAGAGRRLLEHSLRTSSDAGARLICSSDDPRALHRYGSAGFELHPAYQGKGTVDRALLPAVEGVREGSWDDDRERVDELAVQVRGAPIGPDAEVLSAVDARLLVAGGPGGQGYAVVRGESVRPVAATTTSAARALLVTGLAMIEGEATVDFVTAGQQWAIAVMRELRMPFRPSESLATDRFAPRSPYVPDGAYG